jgi:hypothetical protein
MLSALAAFALLAAAPALWGQPDLSVSGPRLKVPSAETHLFFKRQPVVVEGQVVAPLDSVERWLNTKVQGDRRGEFSISYYGETPTAVSLRMWVGQKRAMVAAAEVPLDVAPQVIGDETFVPLRFIAEAVGVWVEPYGRTIRLRKPDEGWECYLAIPPSPATLEGKMLALAIARSPDALKRVEVVSLAPDTMSGVVGLAEPADTAAGVRRYSLRYTRDRTGWHFASEGEPVAPPEPPEE